jgi:anti-sigma regulatory factor (Ser/Thr protein kinase)
LPSNKTKSNQTISITIPSDALYLKIIRSVLADIGEIFKFLQKDINAIELATNEACANIIKHAYNNEPNHQIQITIFGYPEKIKIELQDDGKQVDPDKIKSRNLDEIRPGGLGVHFIHSLMDEVGFDQDYKDGNRLILIKERSTNDSDS